MPDEGLFQKGGEGGHAKGRGHQGHARNQLTKQLGLRVGVGQVGRSSWGLGGAGVKGSCAVLGDGTLARA